MATLAQRIERRIRAISASNPGYISVTKHTLGSLLDDNLLRAIAQEAAAEAKMALTLHDAPVECKQGAEAVAAGLGAISWQINRWLEWSNTSRDREHLTTDDGTHIMALPVPFWPSHGQFREWIKTFDQARALIAEKDGGKQ